MSVQVTSSLNQASTVGKKSVFAIITDTYNFGIVLTAYMHSKNILLIKLKPWLESENYQ